MDAALEVGDTVRGGRGVVAVYKARHQLSVKSTSRIGWGKHLTCSLISSVVPALSSHLPTKSSPRKGFRGFFSLPYCSLLLAYCCFNVVKNHFSTRSALLAASGSLAGAANTDGCSHQYELNSVRLVEDKMKGGAVRLERSPLKDAMD